MQRTHDADGPDSAPGDTPTAGSDRGRLRPLEVALWWTLTILTLVALDDLTFGPVFWALSRWLGILPAVVAVYAVYVSVQVWLVRRGTEPEPGRIAAYLLRRFDLGRRSRHIEQYEHRIRRKVIGGGSAVLLSLLIGGVLPPLLLWRQGFDRRFVRRLSIVTAVVYASEFALLHAVVPGSI